MILAMEFNRRNLIVYLLTHALFVAAILSVFQQRNRVAGILMVLAGVSSISNREKFAATHNLLLGTRWRHIMGAAFRTAPTARGTRFMLFGSGCAAVGVGLLLGG